MARLQEQLAISSNIVYRLLLDHTNTCYTNIQIERHRNPRTREPIMIILGLTIQIHIIISLTHLNGYPSFHSNVSAFYVVVWALKKKRHSPLLNPSSKCQSIIMLVKTFGQLNFNTNWKSKNQKYYLASGAGKYLITLHIL